MTVCTYECSSGCIHTSMCIHLCLCIVIYINIYYTYIYISVYACICVWFCMWLYLHVPMFAHEYDCVDMCIWIYVFLFTCTGVHISCMLACEYELSVYICVWLYECVCSGMFVHSISFCLHFPVSTQIFLLKLFSLIRRWT